MSKTFTLQDVAQRSTDRTGLIVVSKKVYDVTEYLTEHPGGGDDILVEVLGQDATEAFHEVGHSEAAREKLESLLVGKLKVEPQMQDSKVKSVGAASSWRLQRSTMDLAVVFLLLSVSAAFFRFKMAPVNDL
ncbi:putative cytochrome b5 [Colletotrichum sp. SAR 10_66]|nr:putative cytochrome b5 [Colletotrichum sp. SAR 10_75]KAJ4999588.1 putative cytochrome b5 [Colletotrichum sp. SAR 10_66]